MRKLILAALMLCLFNALGFGQATDAILVGTVTDPSGAAIEAANVTATNRDTGVKYTSTTNAEGQYRLNNIPVGTYSVAAAKTGFATATTSNVQLQLNHTTSINLTVQVGTVSTTVEVSDAAAALDTSTAQVQTTYNAKDAVDLGLASTTKTIGQSGIYNLSLLSAGVATTGGVGQGVGPSVAGQRADFNAFNIDGVMNDSHYNPGPTMYVSTEAVQQFTVLQNQFSAEFGAASGGIFNAIVKSGTNQIHGSLYEYLQNRNLNAVDATQVQQGLRSNPRSDINRMGGTIGGPIRKDKLFYFANLEYNPFGQASQPGQTVFAPTAAGISLLNGMSNLSKTNLGVFTKYVPVAPAADPTNPIKVNGVNIPDGPLSFASPNYTNLTDIVGAVDWNVGARDQLRGRYVHNRQRGIDFFAALPVFYSPAPVTNNSVSISEFHNFSPTMENEFRLSYVRNNANTPVGNFQFPGLDVFPNIAIDEIQLQLGPDPNAPSGSIENLSQLQENLTKTSGRHTFKAGLNIADSIISGFFVQRARGDYDYTSLEEFLLDKQPSGSDLSGVSGERSVGTANGVPFGFMQYAGYANDDWRIRSNFTLNLGVRYEYVTVPVGSRAQALNSTADVPGVITFRSPQSNKNEWSPRLGFAYSPGKSGVWSIRGGFSRSFNNTYINLNQNASPPYYQTTVDVNDSQPVSNFLQNGGLKATLASGAPTPAEARAATASYTFDQTRPYALTASLGVQRSLARDYTIEVRYVYTKGVHLWNQTRMNIGSLVTPTRFIPTYFTTPTAAQLAASSLTLGALSSTPLPGATAAHPNNFLSSYGFDQNITGYHPWGNSRYSGLAVQFNKHYSNNFSYNLAYTWSHAFDDSTATNFSTILSPRRAQDFQNLRAEWASSALDRRHRFTFAPIYDLRPFQNRGYFLKNIVGNWTLSMTYTFQSPEYATVQSGVDANLNGDALDRAIINPAGAANVGSGVTALNAAGQTVAAGSASIVAYVANNPNARYIVAEKGARSNSGRNTFPLDHINNFDAQVKKRINITESKTFEIGASAFNVFNHSQFIGGYISDVSSFGTASISRNFLVPSSPFFSHYDGFFSSNSRQMQIVARFVF
jgi:Carboxypeptidase regulatory-like domain/TonB dependent receptor-like, beta-barrel